MAAKRESEGKAVGGACRHAGHAIEDCYAMNKKNDNEPYSFHAGGANCLFTDGHVQFIRDSVPLAVFAAMCTMNAGEVVGD